ncbi:unnamed protein product [Mucor hiemalis]
MLLRSLGITAAAILSAFCVDAKYTSSGPNVFYYWGQNSAGGSNTQGSLASYCQSGQVDAVLVSFLHVFNVGGLPSINLSSACEATFPGTTLLTCPAIGNDIKTCQGLGVKVILSLGGAAGSYSLSGDAQAATFTQTLWDLFGGGTSNTRPFGDSVIDGVDLDIEGGPSTGYASFVSKVRAKFAPAKPDFLVGAAPQCPFPDVILGSVIDAVGFDYINVQFYNNYCSAAGNSFNFNTWANWATTVSPNKNVKIMLTLPGAPTAAGSGYVPITTIQSIVPTLASSYPGVYGGVAIWDASQAWNNGNFASALYSLVKSGSGGTNPTTTSTKTATTTIGTTTTSIIPTTSVSPTKSTTVVSSTTSTAPTSTATTGSCVKAGQSCSTSGQYVCTANGAYATCDHGAWSVTGCPSGTVCIPTADGSSIYCGYATGSGSTCPALNARALFRDILNKGGAIPKPYKVSQVAAQLSVVTSTASEFEALINAHRTVASPFGQQVTITFTAPQNIKVNSVTDGTVRQVGTSVRITYSNPKNESMALVTKFSGTVTSGIFVAPNPASLRFK